MNTSCSVVLENNNEPMPVKLANQMRALLCQRCNLAVGHVRDSPEICRKMAAYLEEHRNVE